MADSRTINRRTLLANGSAAMWAFSGQRELFSFQASSQPAGANSRIRVGVIGTGVRGKYLIGNLPAPAYVVAICDCADSRLRTTLNPAAEFREILSTFRDTAADTCPTYYDYRRMLDREQLDAVIIATPDHHHVQAAMLALDAGLDVYVEKPLTVTVREGRLLADKVRATGRVLQVGSQQRTMEVNRFACEFIRDGGLGQVSRVDLPNYPGPISTFDEPSESVPAGMHWDLFLGPAPSRPYHRKLWNKDEFYVGQLLWRGWDLFRDYSGHLMTNWGAHSVDMIQYALGMDHSGPVKIVPRHDVSDAELEQDWQKKWRKKTPRPTTSWSAARRFRPVTLEYSNGTVLNLLPGIDTSVFHGERGQMAISRNKFRTRPEDLVVGGPDPKLAEQWSGSGHVARPHLQNWLDCIQTRSTPNAPVEVGHRTATVCHLINIARELDRPLQWDPESEEFPGDDQANQQLERPRRPGFQLNAGV